MRKPQIDQGEQEDSNGGMDPQRHVSGHRATQITQALPLYGQVTFNIAFHSLQHQIQLLAEVIEGTYASVLIAVLPLEA